MVFNLFIGLTALAQGNIIAFVSSGGFAILMIILQIVLFTQKMIVLTKSAIKYLKSLSDFQRFNSEAISEKEVKKVLDSFVKHQKQLASK